MGIMSALRQTATIIGKFAPQILTGLGIAGFVSATVMAVEATPEAYNKIKMEEYKRTSDGDNTPITAVDVVKMTWKDYAASLVMIITSTGMIIGGHYMIYKRLSKQLVTMTAAYTMVADQASKYYEKTKQIVGKTKAEDIKTSVAQDAIDDIPEEKFVAAKNLGGDDWFFDELSGQVFKYDLVEFKKKVNEYNLELMQEMWKSVNELYDKIGLERTMMGEILGYDIDQGLVEYRNPYVAQKNGKAVFVLAPCNYPKPRARL